MKRFTLLSLVLCVALPTFAQDNPPPLDAVLSPAVLKLEQPLPTSGEVGIPGVVEFVADGDVLPPTVEKPSLFLQLAGGLLDLLMLAVVGGIGLLSRFLLSKSSESAFARFGHVVTEAARASVLQIDRTLKPQLQAALADGILTPAEKAQLKAAALDLLKSQLPASVLKLGQGVLGSFLDTYLAGKVEQAVIEKNALEGQAPTKRLITNAMVERSLADMRAREAGVAVVGAPVESSLEKALGGLVPQSP